MVKLTVDDMLMTCLVQAADLCSDDDPQQAVDKKMYVPMYLLVAAGIAINPPGCVSNIIALEGELNKTTKRKRSQATAQVSEEVGSLVSRPVLFALGEISLSSRHQFPPRS